KGEAIAFCSTEEKEKLVAIESYLDQKITQIDVKKNDVKETIRMSVENETDWRSLMDETDEQDNKKRKKKKKSRK
ncbi:MAG: ATP-dependent helicase, partial [Salinivirgaceae bacterium]